MLPHRTPDTAAEQSLGFRGQGQGSGFRAQGSGGRGGKFPGFDSRFPGFGFRVSCVWCRVEEWKTSWFSAARECLGFGVSGVRMRRKIRDLIRCLLPGEHLKEQTQNLIAHTSSGMFGSGSKFGFRAFGFSGLKERISPWNPLEIYSYVIGQICRRIDQICTRKPTVWQIEYRGTSLIRTPPP